MQKYNSSMLLGALSASWLLTGCGTTTPNPDLAAGAASYEVIPAAVPIPTVYPIRPKDILTLRVFGEPDISQELLRVDEGGMVQIPLIGAIAAGGRGTAEVGEEIAARLGQRYLRDPQVAVSVKEAAPSYVSVEGEVKKPGVYEIDGRTTLLAAMARAESPTPTAKLNEVVVFRTMNEQRMAARFDIKRIRTGLDPDPMILDGDVVMVGYSSSKGLWQDILKTAPFFNAFALLSTR